MEFWIKRCIPVIAVSFIIAGLSICLFLAGPVLANDSDSTVAFPSHGAATAGPDAPLPESLLDVMQGFVSEAAQSSTPDLIYQAWKRGEISQETAYLYLVYALSDQARLPKAFQSSAPWRGTLPLFDLQQNLATLKAGFEKTAIENTLSNGCGGIVTTLPNTLDTEHFHIEYGAIGGGLTIEDYATFLETAWTIQVDTYGWAAPPALPNNPLPGNRYHVRLDDLGTGLYGFVSTQGPFAGIAGDNPSTPWDERDAIATCMSLNSDYGRLPGVPASALSATIAHEFHHAIQFGLGALTGANAPDYVFVEGSAIWIEDEVFDSSDDNVRFLWPDFSHCMGQYASYPYNYWFIWRGLTESYGTNLPGGSEQIMQDFWSLTSQNAANTLGAMEQAIASAGANLGDAYHNFAIAALHVKTCGDGYQYPFCFEEAVNYVEAHGVPRLQGTIGSTSGYYTGAIQDNYALNWIGLPLAGPYDVSLTNLPDGGQLQASVVCDTGSSLRVARLSGVLDSGASSKLESYDPSGCTSVTAVITNQFKMADNPTSCTVRSYLLQLTPVAADPGCAAAVFDLDQDGLVTVLDIVAVSSRWQDAASFETRFDLAFPPDQRVTVADIMSVSAHFNDGCF